MNIEKNMPIITIKDRSMLVDLAKALELREDWHEPGNQGVTCKMFGSSFDNAGSWGMTCEIVPEALEMFVVLYKDRAPLAEINLATLFSWAADPNTGVTVNVDNNELQLPIDHPLKREDFLLWLTENYPSGEYVTCSYFDWNSNGDKPTKGYVFLRQFETDFFYILRIPQAVNPKHRLIKVEIRESDTKDSYEEIVCTSLFDMSENSFDLADGEAILESLIQEINHRLGPQQLSLAQVYSRYSERLDFGDADDILNMAIENHPSHVDWSGVVEALGFDLDNIASEYVGAILDKRPIQVPKTNIDDEDKIKVAEDFFQLNQEEIISNALDNTSADAIIYIAEDLGIEVSERDKEMMLKLEQ